MNKLNIRPNAVHILLLTVVWLVICTIAYKEYSNTSFVNNKGLFTKGVVKNVRYLKSEYTHQVSFFYEGKLYESKGTSQKKHLTGDTVVIRFNQIAPDNAVILVD